MSWILAKGLLEEYGNGKIFKASLVSQAISHVNKEKILKKKLKFKFIYNVFLIT